MYWNTTKSNTLNISDIGHYVNFEHMRPTNSDGYHCDELQKSPIIFLGSCDLDGPISDTNLCWARQLYEHFSVNYENLPYIALGKITAGLMSMPRRLLTYCEKFGPPERVFAVIPRAVSTEIPLTNGEIVSVSNREGLVHYLAKHNKISVDDQDFNYLMASSKFSQSLFNNFNYQVYQFEQQSSFLKLICERYNIEFRWTMNLSSSAIPYFDRYFDIFMDSCTFMKNTFVGVGLAKDFAFDGSMGELSQEEVFNVLKRNIICTDYNSLKEIMNQNLNTAVNNTPKHQRAMNE